MVNGKGHGISGEAFHDGGGGRCCEKSGGNGADRRGASIMPDIGKMRRCPLRVGHEQTQRDELAHVRFAPQSGHARQRLRMAAHRSSTYRERMVTIRGGSRWE